MRHARMVVSCHVLDELKADASDPMDVQRRLRLPDGVKVDWVGERIGDHDMGRKTLGLSGEGLPDYCNAAHMPEPPFITAWYTRRDDGPTFERFELCRPPPYPVGELRTREEIAARFKEIAATLNDDFANAV